MLLEAPLSWHPKRPSGNVAVARMGGASSVRLSIGSGSTSIRRSDEVWLNEIGSLHVTITGLARRKTMMGQCKPRPSDQSGEVARLPAQAHPRVRKRLH